MPQSLVLPIEVVASIVVVVDRSGRLNRCRVRSKWMPQSLACLIELVASIVGVVFAGPMEKANSHRRGAQ